MCDDSPERRVLFNMLQALYSEHPVRIDIAGTVESISHITPELLYDCYYTFYNLHNMVLTVCGDVSVDTVLEVADRVLIPAEPLSLDTALPAEPLEAAESYIEQIMPVASPLFYLGYKYPAKLTTSAKEIAAAEIIVELLTAPSSALYTKLMQEELINDSFGGEFFEGRGFAVFMFGGESRDPQAVQEAIAAEIAALQQNGVDEARFEELRTALYGRIIRQFNNVETAATVMMDDFMHERAPFAAVEAVASLTAADVNAVLAAMLPERSTLSVVKAKEEA